MFLSELPGYWFVVDRKSPYCKTGVTDFRDKGMTGYSNFQAWWSWKWRFMSIVDWWVFNHWMTSLEHIGDTVMSWQHWPKTEVKVWWTIGMNEPSRILPNPKVTMMEWSVMFKSDLLLQKFCSLSQIFPGHFSTTPSLFCNKLEEDNICLIYNSTLWVNMHRYLII